MNPDTTIPITQARRQIFAIAENIKKTNAFYTLTHEGVATAVIMSAEEFDSWLETMEVDRAFPDLRKDIRAFEKDRASGATKGYTKLEELRLPRRVGSARRG